MQNSVNRRGFSALKRIRTWLQSSNRILNNTLVVSVLMEQSFKTLNLRKQLTFGWLRKTGE